MSLVGLVVDDYGATVEITVKQDDVAIDISSYTTRSVVLRAPSGTETTKTATFKTTGADGILQFTLADGDIDEAGGWALQVLLSKATGELSSSVERFQVESRL